jgi:uncharacterized FAD-dependent dehydrogenase
LVIEVDIKVLPSQSEDESFCLQQVYAKIPHLINRIKGAKLHKRSIDARKFPVVYQLRYYVFLDVMEHEDIHFEYKNVVHSFNEMFIVGSGPAGLFAALECLELGVKPIVFERGKDIRSRRLDLAKLNKEHVLNSESNYCFGEGGAGTYSDGKLYTRSKKRGSIEKVLKVLVFHGADSSILIDAHPHIGTNKLPKIIENIRQTIIKNGGEVHFNAKVTDFIIYNKSIVGIKINEDKIVQCSKLLLATGHSARDMYRLLYAKGITVEFKPFALGVRIEHPQLIIDQSQYKCKERGEFLPPAAYSLVHNTSDRGVYSFCMCPGGVIAPCATEQGEVVTNGWSPSKRNNPYANSGIVTEVRWEDIDEFHHYGPLAGMEFQRSVEHNCWKAAGATQRVPAQRMVDFINNKKSDSLPDSSYFPGMVSVNLNELLPKFIVKALREGLENFGKKMKGYLTNEAVLHAPESRTSSPVRIPRDPVTFEHPDIKGLYPCGEGAGYAGGIVSAAIDGLRIVSTIFEK